MPAVSTAARRRKRRARGGFIRFFLIVVRFIISPFVLFLDSFQAKKNLDRGWLFSFFLLTSLLMLMTGVGLLVVDRPTGKTLQMLADPSRNEEVLAGAFQPVIAAINRYSLQNQLDPNLVYSIIKAESNFKAGAVSRAGARGLMQIMPEVWRQYSHSSCDGEHAYGDPCADPRNCIFNPEANIRVGTRYFRVLLDRYNGRVDLALEAYNAGLTNVQPGFAPKFAETRSYVQKILAAWRELRRVSLAGQLRLSLSMQAGLKVLFGLSFLCWLILFWWANRKLFRD
jgi:hypothetical protein